MSRYVFKRGDQHKFMKAVKARIGDSWEEIASKAGVSGRTLRDWQREVIFGKKEVLSKLSRLSGVSLPPIVEERKEWWNTRAWSKRANKIRMKLYGPPGTPEGRSKGGKISQLHRKLYPEKYIGTRVILKNKFRFPENSTNLAEFMGIMLGDGGMSKDQIKITLDRNADGEYALVVRKMAKDLFGKNPSIYIRKECNALTICLTGVDLVDYLVNKGLCIGSKMKANIGIPEWIKFNLTYSKLCIRGLVDTDGCLFIHKYKLKEKEYRYKNICFVSYIPNLMADVKEQLQLLGYTPKGKGTRLFLYNQNEAIKYFREIGTSNPKNVKRWKIV